MGKNAIKIFTFLFLICFFSSACAKVEKDNVYQGNIDFFDDLSDEKVSSDNFSDFYYFSMLYSPANGNWSQSEVTYLLTKYIEDDLNKNKDDSQFAFLCNTTTPFFYTVDTGTGKNSISFLVKTDGEANDFPKSEFLELQMFVTYYGENRDDLDSYELEVFVGDTVAFESTEDLLEYVNSDMHNFSVFFERGWLTL